MRLYIRKRLTRMRQKLRKTSTMQIVVLAFLFIILLGTMLLSLPVASKAKTATPFFTALFTATSATCVTGLTLVDTFTHWSGFGQAVLLCLIQIGGLGFMTIVSLFFFAANRRIGLKDRLIMAQSLGVDQLSGVVKMVKHVLIGTFAIELAGAVILTLCFLQDQPFAMALWQGVFHAVSAFCNAGFDILGAVDAGGSLIPYCTHPVVNLTLIALIVLGGLGFFVWEDVREKKKFHSFTVYTKLVLVVTAVLLFGGAVMTAVLEWNNPATIGSLSVPQKLLASLFQSATWRTAGFYTFPQGGLTTPAKAFGSVLMFIGGSSGSTAGGAKTVTMAVLVLSVLASARGRSRLTVFHRTIHPQQVTNAVSVIALMFGVAFAAAVFLSATNGLDFLDCAYETVSAIATVGISVGITPVLNTASQLVIIVCMFFGRVGIMTISLGFLLSDQTQERYHYAETKVMIG